MKGFGHINMTNYQMTGILAQAMTGATGEALTRFLDNQIKLETDLLLEAEGSAIHIRVGRLAALYDIKRSLGNMSLTNSMLEKDKIP